MSGAARRRSSSAPRWPSSSLPAPCLRCRPTPSLATSRSCTGATSVSTAAPARSMRRHSRPSCNVKWRAMPLSAWWSITPLPRGRSGTWTLQWRRCASTMWSTFPRATRQRWCQCLAISSTSPTGSTRLRLPRMAALSPSACGGWTCRTARRSSRGAAAASTSCPATQGRRGASIRPVSATFLTAGSSTQTPTCTSMRWCPPVCSPRSEPKWARRSSCLWFARTSAPRRPRAYASTCTSRFSPRHSSARCRASSSRRMRRLRSCRTLSSSSGRRLTSGFLTCALRRRASTRRP